LPDAVGIRRCLLGYSAHLEADLEKFWREKVRNSRVYEGRDGDPGGKEGNLDPMAETG